MAHSHDVFVNTSRRITSLVALVLISTSACSFASYDDKMTYLRAMAKRGVETHNLLVSQGATVDSKRCTAAYEGLNDDIPQDGAVGGTSREWIDQVKPFFVDSCVSGLPKPIPSQAPASGTPSVSPSSSVLPSTSPSKSPK